MNDLLRAIDRLLLRPFGYRIQRARQVNLRPIDRLRGLDDLDDLDSLAAGKLLFDRDETAPAPRALTVYLRTCLREPRRSRRHDLVDDPLEVVVATCVASLVASVNRAAETAGLAELRVVVDDDRSDSDARATLEAVLGRLSVPWEIRTPAETRAGPVMHAQFREAAGADRLVYFVEDDYLHAPEAVSALVGFYRQVHCATGGQLVLHPQEQRVLYDRHYPSWLVLGADRRWRTTRHMSHTLFTHGRVVADHWRFFENTRYVGHGPKRRRHKGAERRTTNRLMTRLPGFCPIPALAAHFQAENLLPPFFDWRPLYAANRVAPADGRSDPGEA